MKVLIVDDERLARAGIQRLLKDVAQIEIVGEAENIEEAEKFISDNSVDLILLDISMPGGDGFELLEKLTMVPQVIFTTAFDKFAIKAFEVNALDYLVKPIEKERLLAAIQKGLERHEVSIKNNTALDMTSKVFVKEGDQCWFIPVKDIVALESIGNHTRLFIGKNNPIIHRNLSYMEERLPTAHFMRANRQEIFNLTAVSEVDIAINGNIELKLSNGRQVELSRRQSQIFRDQMSL